LTHDYEEFRKIKMAISITGGTFSGGIQMFMPPPPVPLPSAIYDLDAANFTTLPFVQGSILTKPNTWVASDDTDAYLIIADVSPPAAVYTLTVQGPTKLDLLNEIAAGAPNPGTMSLSSSIVVTQGVTSIQTFTDNAGSASNGGSLDTYIREYIDLPNDAIYTITFNNQINTAGAGTPVFACILSLTVVMESTPFTEVKDATGTYTMTSRNTGYSITWNSANGGSWIKSNNTGTDTIYGGPNYTTGQSYTVFMAYKLSATSAGRLLNTQSEASKDWMMGAYNGNPSAFYPNFSVNLPSSGADTAWHLDFATWNTSTNTGSLYTSTSTAPTSAAFTSTSASGGGFNQLRMWSRSSGSEVQTGNIAFVKVYDRVLSLSEIQALHAEHKTRFGY